MNLYKALDDLKVEEFASHYNMYYTMVFSVIYSKTSNYHDAEDIAQEVFIRFYQKMEEIEEPRKWLHGCVRNVILDHYRKKHRNEEDISQMLDDVSMGYVNGFRDARIVITAVIDEVSNECEPGDAALFQMIAVNNFSFKEASAHMKLNYKKTIYRYNRICDMILSRLREKGIKQLEDLL